MPGCVRVFVGTHVYCSNNCTAGVSELCHAELGALDFEEGPWFCRLLCPSLESVFNYPPHCAKRSVRQVSQPPAQPPSRTSSPLPEVCVLCSKSRVIGTGPLKSPGGLCHEHGFKCLPLPQIWKEAVPFCDLAAGCIHLGSFSLWCIRVS